MLSVFRATTETEVYDLHVGMKMEKACALESIPTSVLLQPCFQSLAPDKEHKLAILIPLLKKKLFGPEVFSNYCHILCRIIY